MKDKENKDNKLNEVKQSVDKILQGLKQPGGIGLREVAMDLIDLQKSLHTWIIRHWICFYMFYLLYYQNNFQLNLPFYLINL